MPNIKSAKKRMRQNEEQRKRNRHYRSRMRTQIKKFHELLDGKDIESASSLLKEVYSVIDRTAQKGVIHANAAARYKSRLTKHLNESS